MRALLILAAGLALTACADEFSSPITNEVGAVEAGMRVADGAAASGGDATGGGAPLIPTSGAAPDSVGLELIRTGTLDLHARDHADAVGRARAATREAGGRVVGEESARGASRVSTTLTLRVPAARFDALMAALAEIPGDVDRRSVRVDDVTRPVADVTARLRVRRAAESRLVELLGQARTVDDVLAVQTRLDAVREEIESADAQLRALRTDVALSTIHLTVYEESAAGLGQTSWGRRLARAVGGGWDGLLEGLLVAAGLWPLWLVGGGAVWWVRRRRRARVTPRSELPS